MPKKIDSRTRRHIRVRKKVKGTAERPRLNVFKSTCHIYAQIIDDVSHSTLASASTHSKDLPEYTGHKGNIEAAKLVGGLVGKKASEKNIKSVVFDRGGYLFHGRVKALADAAREAGLEF